MLVVVATPTVEPHSHQHRQHIYLIRQAEGRCSSCGQPVASFYDHTDGDDLYTCQPAWGDAAEQAFALSHSAVFNYDPPRHWWSAVLDRILRLVTTPLRHHYLNRQA